MTAMSSIYLHAFDKCSYRKHVIVHGRVVDVFSSVHIHVLECFTACRRAVCGLIASTGGCWVPVVPVARYLRYHNPNGSGGGWWKNESATGLWGCLLIMFVVWLVPYRTDNFTPNLVSELHNMDNANEKIVKMEIAKAEKTLTRKFFLAKKEQGVGNE